MILIGLAGAAGSGKDSVADHLCQHYGFVRFSFSDALYREVAAAYGLPDESLLRNRATKEEMTDRLALERCDNPEFVAVASQWLRKKHALAWVPNPLVLPLSPREVLQLWGTEFRRAQDPDYWVEQADNWLIDIRRLSPYPECQPQLFVNTSVRFPNERAWIKSWEGNVWHLHRDAASPVAGHKSETPLPVLMGEREIFNNYTLEYLGMGIDRLLASNVQSVHLEPPAPMVEPTFYEEAALRTAAFAASAFIDAEGRN